MQQARDHVDRAADAAALDRRDHRDAQRFELGEGGLHVGQQVEDRGAAFRACWSSIAMAPPKVVERHAGAEMLAGAARSPARGASPSRCRPVSTSSSSRQNTGFIVFIASERESIRWATSACTSSSKQVIAFISRNVSNICAKATSVGDASLCFEAARTPAAVCPRARPTGIHRAATDLSAPANPCTDPLPFDDCFLRSPRC